MEMLDDMKKLVDLWFNSGLDGLHSRSSEKEATDPETCAKCNGKCCKQCGCHYSPTDFTNISFSSLKKEIEQGYISIDAVGYGRREPKDKTLILRVRNKNSKIVDLEFKSSPCILLTETGCKLRYEDRPLGGKALIPSKSFQCYSMYSIKECCIQWKPYQSILGRLAKYFLDKDYPCSL